MKNTININGIGTKPSVKVPTSIGRVYRFLDVPRGKSPKVVKVI